MEYDLELFRLRLKIKEVNVKGSIEVLVVVGEGLRLFGLLVNCRDLLWKW